MCRCVPQGSNFALGNLRQYRGNEIGLAWKVAVDGPGGDAGALRHGRDLHCRHAAFACRFACGSEDCGVPRRKPPLHIFGPAIRHVIQEIQQ